MTHKWVEVTIRLIGEDYKQTVDMYSQRMHYEYYYEIQPNLIAEIAAVVNGLNPSAKHHPFGPSTRPTEQL